MRQGGGKEKGVRSESVQPPACAPGHKKRANGVLTGHWGPPSGALIWAQKEIVFPLLEDNFLPAHCASLEPSSLIVQNLLDTVGFALTVLVGSVTCRSLGTAHHERVKVDETAVVSSRKRTVAWAPWKRVSHSWTSPGRGLVSTIPEAGHFCAVSEGSELREQTGLGVAHIPHHSEKAGGAAGGRAQKGETRFGCRALHHH